MINQCGHYSSVLENDLEQTTIEDYVVDVEKVMQDSVIENCALVRHSMGELIVPKIVMHFKSIKALISMSSASPFGMPIINNDPTEYFSHMPVLEKGWE